MSTNRKYSTAGLFEENLFAKADDRAENEIGNSGSMIAALVDFASNLLVTAGNSKGVGLTYAKQQFPKYENEYRNASERLGKHMRDFSGRVARARVWNPLTGKGAEKTDVTTSGSLRLLSGSFKRALESFDRSSGLNKMF